MSCARENSDSGGTVEFVKATLSRAVGRQGGVVRADDEQRVFSALLGAVNEATVGLGDEGVDVVGLVGEDRKSRAHAKHALAALAQHRKIFRRDQALEALEDLLGLLR